MSSISSNVKQYVDLNYGDRAKLSELRNLLEAVIDYESTVKETYKLPTNYLSMTSKQIQELTNKVRRLTMSYDDGITSYFRKQDQEMNEIIRSLNDINNNLRGARLNLEGCL